VNNHRIKSFDISSQEGYSEYWRRNKSPIEILELAKLLVAIRKISSFVGMNIGNIVWSGMECTDGISLDPSLLMGKYPIPATSTDIMIGVAIRKAFLKTEWSGLVKSIILNQINITPLYAYKFDLYMHICENVYVDCLANRSVFGLYTEKAREWECLEKSKYFPDPPTVTELLHIWWKIAADRSGIKYNEEYVDRSVGRFVDGMNIEKYYLKPIALLNSIMQPLIHDVHNKSGVIERCNSRVALYLSIWPSLLQYIKFWPADRADPILLYNNLDEDIAKEEEERKAVKATIISYAEEIEKAIKPKSIDYTQELKSIVKNVADVVRIEGNDIVFPTKLKIDKMLLRKIELVIKLVTKRKTIYSRGLNSGKVDRRRLYRTFTTGAVFQLKKNKYELNNDVILLIDCTGSMSNPAIWEYSEKIYQTIFMAIKKYNHNVRIIGYNEVKGICCITELYIDNKFYSVLPHGKTASGEAIIATALSLKKQAKRPLIIHITDGASNWGCGVADAIEYCKKNKINLFTLGLGCNKSSRNALRNEYGKFVQFIDKIDFIPSQFRALLNHVKTY
jgi:hypothetical protein